MWAFSNHLTRELSQRPSVVREAHAFSQNEYFVVALVFASTCSRRARRSARRRPGPGRRRAAPRSRPRRAASRRPAGTARRASDATRSAGPRRRRRCRTAAGPGRRRAAPRPRRTGSRRRASAACTPRSGASPSSAFAAAAPARLSITTKAKSRRHLLFLILRTARDDYGAVLEGTTRPARGRGVMSSLLVTRGVSSQKLSGGRRPAPRVPRGASPVCRRRTCPSLTGKRL